MSALNNLLHEFEATNNYIKAVLDILRDGHMPDMTGLDERVERLCNAIAASEAEIQQQCLPKLNDLLQKLDICENEVRAFRAAQTEGNKQ